MARSNNETKQLSHPTLKNSYMTTKDLITAIAADTGMRKQDVERLLEATTDACVEQLLDGKSIQVQNFGTLEIKTKAERQFIHPTTGKRQVAPEKKQFSFKQNSVLKEAVNNK